MARDGRPNARAPSDADDGDRATTTPALDLVARLRRALGDAFDGGVLVMAAPYEGPTPTQGGPPVHALARLHPWPLEQGRLEAMRREGLELQPPSAGADERLVRGPEGGALLLDFESERWTVLLAVRDYVAAGHAARGGGGGADEIEGAALRWAVTARGFEPLVGLTRLLAGAGVPWAVGGGWALDLWLGAPTRAHDDLDLVIGREAAPRLLAHLLRVGVDVAPVDGGRHRRHRPGDGIPERAHQVHGRLHETLLDVVMEPRDGGDWVYRRDPAVRLSAARAFCVRDVGGVRVPFLAPEAMLLFKSHTSSVEGGRQKDRDDLALVAPHLGLEALGWLDGALARANVQHPWRALLEPHLRTRLADRTNGQDPRPSHPS